jgi:hypothetical protein
MYWHRYRLRELFPCNVRAVFALKRVLISWHSPRLDWTIATIYDHSLNLPCSRWAQLDRMKRLMCLHLPEPEPCTGPPLSTSQRAIALTIVSKNSPNRYDLYHYVTLWCWDCRFSEAGSNHYDLFRARWVTCLRSTVLCLAQIMAPAWFEKRSFLIFICTIYGYCYITVTGHRLCVRCVRKSGSSL